MKIEVRAAAPEDAPAIARLTRALGYAVELDESASALAGLLVDPDHAVVVADRGIGDIVGWIHVFRAVRLESGTFAEVGGLVVAPDARRSGVGRLLLEAAERWAVDRGIVRLRVRTRTDRHAAHAFYERAGFRLTKSQDVFDRPIGSSS